MKLLRNIMERSVRNVEGVCYGKVTYRHGMLRKRYRVLRSITEHFRALRDVMIALRIVTKRYGSIWSPYGMLQNHYEKYRF